MSKDNSKLVQFHFAAGYSAVAVETADENRTIAAVIKEVGEKTPVYICGATGDLLDARSKKSAGAGAGYAAGFAKLRGMEGKPNDPANSAVVIFLDFHQVARNPAAYRPLLQSLAVRGDIKAGTMAVLLAPRWQLPAELEHQVAVVRHALPTRAQLRASLDDVVKGAANLKPPVAAPSEEAIGNLLDAAAGLTLPEAADAFSLALVTARSFDAQVVMDEKMRLVRASGRLEVSPVAKSDEVGGLDGLKDFVRSEVVTSKDDPQLRVQGILLVGVPGTGKSLSARAAGSELGWPVLRMDLAALKGSLVGQSEGNLRAALEMAEAVAPTVLWLDEIDKSLGGAASSHRTDGGTLSGMLGILLTWLQEQKAPVFVVATCNDFSKLPPELARRFDATFFVDLPTLAERRAIASVHLARLGCKAGKLPEIVASMTKDWTGDEIAKLIKSAARRTGRQITNEALEEAAKHIRPIAKIKPEEIEALRTWGKNLRAANSPATPEDSATGTGRTIRLEDN